MATFVPYPPFIVTMLNVSTTLVDCTIVVAALLWFALSRRRKAVILPPGPKGYPLIGNVFDMTVPEMWEVAQKWGKVYGALSTTAPFKFFLNH